MLVSLHLSVGEREAAGRPAAAQPGPLGIDRTRKWNVSPGLFKEQERLGARRGRPRRVPRGGGLRGARCTWFDLLDGREQLRLQTEKYLKQLPDVVSEPGFYNLLTG